ncbi:MAG: hypothetical protein GY943_36045, partial [Chloroflexi bacterium]|nr:hypothetical protein [Chloroflexota bacterium]
DQVGLRAWPVTLDDHIDLWNGEELTTLEGLFLFWNQEGFVDLDAEDERFLYTAVDFLMRQFSSRSPAFMQAHMNVRGNSFNRWVSETIAININEPFAGTGATIYNLDNEWHLMVQLLQTAQTSDERPIAIPHQDVQLLCTDDGNEPLLTTLWRYNLETNEWIAEANTASFMLMYPLADDSSIILLQIGFEQEDQRARLELWNQESIQLLSRDDRYMISLGQMHPSGDYLYSYIQPASNFPPVSEHLLQNLTDCDEVGCAEQDLPGMPVWSPSGDHAIYMEAPFLSIAPTLPDGRVWLIDELPVGEMFPLFRGNGDGNPDSMVNVAFGYSPFWLDDSTYGFIQGIDQLNQSLQIASIEDDVPQQLIEMADILAALPEDVNPRRLTMDYVIPDPYRESHFFLIMSDIDFHGYIFRVDRNTGEVEFRVDVGLMIRHMTGFSPNGRYLVTTRNFIDAGIDGSTDFISFHDVDGNNTQNFLYDSPDFFSAFVFDWSYDGNWMITILDEGVLQLMAPEYNYRQLIEHDFGVCQSVAW